MRGFSTDDQDQFALLTGDTNPLHMDALYARRTQFGRPLVHGMHLLLWALEEYCARVGPVGILQLRCTLRGPVGIGEEVRWRLKSSDGGKITIDLECRGEVCTTLIVTKGDLTCASLEINDADPAKSDPLDCGADVLNGQKGDIELTVSSARLKAMFPKLDQMIPVQQLAVILTTTRLVGMYCPGLHSIYSALQVSFSRPTSSEEPPMMHWHVRDYDDRFQRLSLDIAAPAASGTITAMRRPSAQQQPGTIELKAFVHAAVFAGQRALVVGGSRGLGELCAKLLAAGGADVTLTYHRGLTDAKGVVEDICGAGGRARSVHYDVLNADADLTEVFMQEWVPTHAYYFPTPPIFIAARAKFSASIFAHFCDYYVAGFNNLYIKLRALTNESLSLYYPSSIAAEESFQGMGEYGAAKAAGESLCSFLSLADRKLSIKLVRLPRLPSDQTLSLVEAETESPIETMLRFLAPDTPT